MNGARSAGTARELENREPVSRAHGGAESKNKLNAETRSAVLKDG